MCFVETRLADGYLLYWCWVKWAWVQLHFICFCATNWRVIINFTFFSVPWRRWSLWGLRFMWFVWAILYSWFCHATVGCLVPDFLQPKILHVKCHVTILAERCNNTICCRCKGYLMNVGLCPSWMRDFSLPRLSRLNTCVCDRNAVMFFFFSLMNKVYLQLKLCILMVQTCLRPVCHYYGWLNKHLLEAIM